VIPDPDFMRAYGTEQVYQAKLAGMLPAAAAVALPILGYMALRAGSREDQHQREAYQRADVQARAIEALRSSGDEQALRSGMGLMSGPPGQVPGYGDDDQDLLGAGKLAAKAGRILAKQAGIGQVLGGIGSAGKALVGAIPGIGRGSWKAQALTGAAGVGAAYGAVKGTKALMGAAGAPAHTQVQGFGAGLPNYVNPYGTPIMGH
jgi:hypothetical protein